MIIAVDGVAAGVIGVADVVKENSVQVIEELRKIDQCLYDDWG